VVVGGSYSPTEKSGEWREMGKRGRREETKGKRRERRKKRERGKKEEEGQKSIQGRRRGRAGKGMAKCGISVGVDNNRKSESTSLSWKVREGGSEKIRTTGNPDRISGG